MNITKPVGGWLPVPVWGRHLVPEGFSCHPPTLSETVPATLHHGPKVSFTALYALPLLPQCPQSPLSPIIPHIPMLNPTPSYPKPINHHSFMPQWILLCPLTASMNLLASWNIPRAPNTTLSRKERRSLVCCVSSLTAGLYRGQLCSAKWVSPLPEMSETSPVEAEWLSSHPTLILGDAQEFYNKTF